MVRIFDTLRAKADSGKTYHLPWAEYDGAGNLTNSQVRDIARAAADSTGKRNAILVTEPAAAVGSDWKKRGNFQRKG